MEHVITIANRVLRGSNHLTLNPDVLSSLEQHAAALSGRGDVKGRQASRFVFPAGLVVPPTTGDTPSRYVERAWAHHVLRAAQTSLAVVLGCFGDTSEVVTVEPDEDPFVVLLATLDCVDKMLPFVKEVTTYVSAKALGQEESTLNTKSYQALADEASKLGVMIPRVGRIWCSGRLKKFCDWLCAPRSRESVMFQLHVHQAAQNVLFIKRGLPAAEPWIVQAAVEKHKKTLTEPHVRPDAALLEYILSCADHLVDEIFPPEKTLWHPTAPMPSTHASFLAPVVEGGALRRIVELGQSWEARERAIRSDPEGDMWSRPLGDLPQPSLLTDMYEVRPGVVVEGRALPSKQRTLDAMIAAAGFETHSEARDGIRVRPAPVVEPAKVRMITIGESASYWFGLSIQKMLLRGISRITTFQWTSKPISQEDWAASFPPDVITRLVEQGYLLVSGDYTGATDNLDPLLSERIWDRICRNVQVAVDIDGHVSYIPLSGTVWSTVGKSGLTGHRLFYGPRGDPGPAFKQAWGQLMGSPVSFPVLNIANAAATAVGLGWSIGESVKEVLNRHHVRTNGDDIAFVVHESSYPRWKEAVTAAGLSLSLGKNYVSKSFIIMNSEMRHLLPERLREKFSPECAKEAGCAGGADPYWQFISFLNIPLLWSMDAKGPKAGQFREDLCWWELGARCRALCREAPPDLTKRRTRLFVAANRQALERAPAGVLWEAPEALGGIGLPVFRELSSDIADAARPLYRERCAWLATHDDLSRLKLVTPPPLGVIEAKIAPMRSWVRQAVAAAMVLDAHVEERVSKSRTFMTDDFLPERLMQLKSSPSFGKGRTLANITASLLAQLDSVSSLPEDHRDATPEQVRTYRETLMARRIAKQTRAAHSACLAASSRTEKYLDKSDMRYLCGEAEPVWRTREVTRGIHAMTVESVLEWQNHFVVEERSYGGSYAIEILV